MPNDPNSSKMPRIKVSAAQKIRLAQIHDMQIKPDFKTYESDKRMIGELNPMKPERQAKVALEMAQGKKSRINLQRRHSI